MDWRRVLREQSKFKVFIAFLIVITLLFTLLLKPHGKKYMAEVEEELKVARLICEQSTDWVLENVDRLKLDNNMLETMTGDGNKIKFKHVKYPRAVLLHDGYGHPNAQVEFYCTFRDPSTSDGQIFYFDYRTRTWIDKTISRR